MGELLKYLSLATLTIQGSAFAIVVRSSRLGDGARYFTSVSVLYTELFKFILCILITIWDQSRGLTYWDAEHHKQATWTILKNSPPLAIPSFCYVIQQGLLIVGATYLDAVSFQICVNLKVIPTALFAVILLGKNLSLQQWLSMPVMAMGTAFATIANSQQQEQLADTEVRSVSCPCPCLFMGLPSLSPP